MTEQISNLMKCLACRAEFYIVSAMTPIDSEGARKIPRICPWCASGASKIDSIYMTFEVDVDQAKRPAQAKLERKPLEGVP